MQPPPQDLYSLHCTVHIDRFIFFKGSFLRASLFLKNERLMNVSLDKYIYPIIFLKGSFLRASGTQLLLLER